MRSTSGVWDPRSVSDLHAACEPHVFGRLEAGEGQTIYWETVGDPGGIPVVYLHGGPGSGSTPSHDDT